jgi:hypothetical protein
MNRCSFSFPFSLIHLLKKREKKLCREVLSGSLHTLSMVEGNSNVNSPDRTEKPCTPEIHKRRDRSHIEYGLVGGFGNKAKDANAESLKLKDDSECRMIVLSGSLNGSLNMNADDSFMVPSQNGEKCKNIANTIQDDNREEKMNKCMESYVNGSPSNVKVKVRSSFFCLSDNLFGFPFN